jgi:hypothetical protein
MNNWKEEKMRWITKLEIFLMAITLTFFLFNLMVPSSAVEIIKIGKQAGFEIISNVLS